MNDRRTNIENKMTVAPQAGGADGGSISLTLLDQNLNALSEVDESPAARLRLVRVEDHFTPAVGRDGHATLRRRLADGSAIWHGRTSMPTISGPALLEQFEVGSGNVAFEGIGHGREAVLILERFASHQVLFILEPDPVAMVGALVLHDLARAIRRRRLLLYVDDNPIEALLKFLIDNPDVAPPECFPQWPWREPHEILRFKRDLEAVHSELAGRRRRVGGAA